MSKGKKSQRQRQKRKQKAHPLSQLPSPPIKSHPVGVHATPVTPVLVNDEILEEPEEWSDAVPEEWRETNRQIMAMFARMDKGIQHIAQANAEISRIVGIKKKPLFVSF